MAQKWDIMLQGPQDEEGQPTGPDTLFCVWEEQPAPAPTQFAFLMFCMIMYGGTYYAAPHEEPPVEEPEQP